MPLIEVSTSLEATLHASRLLLVNGPPNSGKTGSLYTAKGPLIAITLPQEKGDGTMPLKTRDGHVVKHFKSDIDPNAVTINWRGECDLVIKLIKEIAAGKHGPCTTLAMDGAHKLYDTMFRANCGGSVKAIEEKAVGRKYGETHGDFSAVMDLVNRSRIPYRIWTCWDGVKVDDQVSKVTKDSPKSIYVGLPGQMGRNVLGEFSFVLNSYTMGGGEGKKFKWRLEPSGDYENAGKKIRRDLIEKIKLPSTMDQDFTALDDLLTEQLTIAWKETMA